MKIVFLGWGSLLWDQHQEFDAQNDEWQADGPCLKIEFSRVSSSRNGALTLVLDTRNGNECQVSYALSKRKNPNDAICDLRGREGTTLNNIGFYFADNSRVRAKNVEITKIIQKWALLKKFDVVIWTDLKSNFQEKSKCRSSFTIEAAISHIQALNPEGKIKAAEYIWRAPGLVVTPLRDALQKQPWFQYPD